MTKVLHIFNALMPSGAETMWRAAACLLKECGVETHVLATAQDIGSYADEMRKAGFIVHHIPNITGRELYRFVKHNEFAAVVNHTEERLFTHGFFSRRVGVPVVCVHHSEFKWRGKSWLKRCVVVAMLRLMGCRLVAVSKSVAENERRFGHRPQVIWNWMDESRFEGEARPRDDVRREFGLGADDKVLITVGNCTWVKNHAFLFRMLKCLPREHKLLHVGKENEPEYGERRLVEELGLADRVMFLGGRTDLKDLFGASDAIVMSSKCEGLGLACVEAIYCGLPAVVLDVEGLRDIAERVEFCHLAEADEQAFAKKVVEVASGARPAVQDCRAAVRGFLSMERSVGEYLKLLGVHKVSDTSAPHIAVLMTCHNRKQTTLRCLQSLVAAVQESKSKVEVEQWKFDLFIVDDGSTDGTSAAIKNWYNSEILHSTSFILHLIRGNGSLYWAKGMALAWSEALKYEQLHSSTSNFNFNYFLWLNDDTILNKEALASILHLQPTPTPSLIVGALTDERGKMIYGLEMTGALNGNVVLIPRQIYKRVGIICGKYAHAWADCDYGYQVEKAGFKMVSAGIVGQTEGHELRPSLRGKSLRERWSLLFDPKGWNLHDLWLLRYRNWNILYAIASCLHMILHVIFSERSKK